MVSNVNAIALSGLRASEARLNASANNIANLQSTTSVVNGVRVNRPYAPQQVVQSSLADGGVQATTRTVKPSSVPVYDPSNIAADANGITDYPNVNLEEEVVNQQIASYDFKANLKVLKTQDKLTEDLLNITA